MIKGQNSFLNELVKSTMPSQEFKVNQLLVKHNDDEMALEDYVTKKMQQPKNFHEIG